jgi:hypothetical protein
MIVYIVRLLTSSTLTSIFNTIAIQWFKFDYQANEILSLVAPLLASALLIPIAYFALDWVFKKTDTEKELI